ncbi:8-oxo-dGTP diphosphatase [Streptococcus gallolyticus]|uniref:8-oxo-dGTP diphosphatase n=1 Tax=Streptococcus hepaticus TaxID=3349163 RepID=UPI001C969342|nr:8-oxo-dGTP diphosphatase [Streptococcus gallolyticus]MBY5040565.1 8-oxo-dGTP diphosphatase [Streptococcus gallolyticus]
MSRSQPVILTNMCLIEDENGNVVVQDRPAELYSWHGIAFPGGHIEGDESLHEAVVREVYEETGLTIENPRLVGMKNWTTRENERYLVFLYRTNQFSGTLRSSEEGEVKWLPKSSLTKDNTAGDLLTMLEVMENPDLSELYYRGHLDHGYQTELR